MSESIQDRLEYHRAYKLKHKEKWDEYHRLYRANNREKARLQAQEYRDFKKESFKKLKERYAG
tara:strand:- start:4106 stop:4294 length:189 start_codon:yes stop_codon:yes gene_type:complete